MNRLNAILFFCTVLFLSTACEKDVEPEAVQISLALEEPTGCGRTFVTLHGSVSATETIRETGFVWWKAGEEGQPYEAICKDNALPGVSVALEGLEAGRNYEYYLYVSNGIHRQTSEKGNFTTPLVGPPLVSAVTLSGERGNCLAAFIKEDGVDDSGTHILKKGICWNTEGSPTLADYVLPVLTTGNAFEIEIPNLQEHTYYSIRAFAENDNGYSAYGPELRILTEKTIPRMGEILVLDTLKKQFLASVADPGGSEITSRGFCWNTTAAPTVEDSFLEVGEEAGGDWVATLDPLLPGTTYAVRAFARNSYGIAYSEELNVTILALPVPVLGEIRQLDAAMNIFQCVVLDPGEGGIESLGFCWNHTGEPTVADTTVEADENFTARLQDLSPGFYYVRAFAVNVAGTGYSSTFTFVVYGEDVPEK